MIRSFLFAAALWVGAFHSVSAQDASPWVAHVDPTQSQVRLGDAGVEMQLHLSQGVPFRVFTLENPPRFVIDLRGADVSDLRAEQVLNENTKLSDLRLGVYREGWSRLVADVSEPMLPRDVSMQVDETTGAAVLQLTLAPVSAARFAAAADAPDDVLWPREDIDETPPALSDGRFVVVLDPGHGGIDPGAERQGVSEKELMLDMALALRASLERVEGVDVVLTRESDVFVSLQARVARAHRAKADVFLSLHADALSQGGAQGATIYLLSEEASDKASAHLAARHNRADIIAGADLTGADDEIASVLLDLARQETQPRSEALALSLISSLTHAGGPMNARPLRRAGFSVLKSADIPSALIEVGFLSSKRDLENLRNPQWRAGIVEALAEAVLTWRETDEARRKLARK